MLNQLNTRFRCKPLKIYNSSIFTLHIVEHKSFYFTFTMWKMQIALSTLWKLSVLIPQNSFHNPTVEVFFSTLSALTLCIEFFYLNYFASCGTFLTSGLQKILYHSFRIVNSLYCTYHIGENITRCYVETINISSTKLS